MPAFIRYGIPVAFLWAVGFALFEMGKRTERAATTQSVIDTLERINDAPLSEGVPNDDRAIILDWLRENQ